MAASLPKHCMVMVYFAKGLKLKQLLNDGWYGVMTGSETEETTHSIYVERLGSKLRLRNCPGTEFGSIDQVVEDAQRLLGENPEQVRFALYAAGLSTPKQTQKVFENKLVGSSWGCDSVDVSSSLDSLPALGSLPQKALDETIAVFRTVIDQWDDETFPNDDHDDYFIDKCEGCIFIVPEFSSEDYSKDDIALFRDEAENGSSTAQYAMSQFYLDGVLSSEKDNEKKAREWMLKAFNSGSEEAARELPELFGVEGVRLEMEAPVKNDNLSFYYGKDFYATIPSLPDHCLIELSFASQLTKRAILQNEIFRADSEGCNGATLRLYKNGDELALVDGDSIVSTSSKNSFFAHCLNKLPNEVSMVALARALGMAGLIKDDLAFSAMTSYGRLGTDELNIFDDVFDNRSSLARTSERALERMVAVSRKVAPNWNPGETKVVFDSDLSFIGFVSDASEYCINMFFARDLFVYADLRDKNNPNSPE